MVVPTVLLFALFIGDAPAGTVRLDVEGTQVRYSADQYFARAPDGTRGTHFERTFTLSEKAPPPEVWWLSRLRTPGCQTVIEERAGTEEQVCLTEVAGLRVRGRITDTPFEARYSRQGVLEALTLAGARFERVSRAPSATTAPLGQGFPLVRGRAVTLEPALTGVQRVTVTPSAAEATTQNCLDVAQAFVGSHRGTSIVLGLLLEAGRAWPHAWVRTPRGDQDPSVPLGADVSDRVYLALPAGQAGRVYLELSGGQRRVIAP